jgi:hypothetical protein
MDQASLQGVAKRAMRIRAAKKAWKTRRTRESAAAVVKTTASREASRAAKKAWKTRRDNAAKGAAK